MSTLADLPEVVGFFSYSREDDDSYKGRLSALREAVQSELGALLGRSRTSFRLWQDKEAIAPGKLWESEIKTAVEQSVFFIPIVTPRAINSDYCKFEFEAFLTRERELGRADLVFPILYVPVPALANEAQWRNHPVLSAVARRQYVDWQTFRYSDVYTPAMREEIARFCRNIVEALCRSWLSPEERKQREEAEATRLAEEESRRRQAEADRRAEDEARRKKAAAEAEEAARLAEERRRQDAENRRLAGEAAVQRQAEAAAGRPPEGVRFGDVPDQARGTAGAAHNVTKPHPNSSRRALLIGGGAFGAGVLATVAVILTRESNGPSAETTPTVSQPPSPAPTTTPQYGGGSGSPSDNSGLVGTKWTGVAEGAYGRAPAYFQFQTAYQMRFLFGAYLNGSASPGPPSSTDPGWQNATWTLSGDALHIETSGGETWDGTVTGDHMAGSGQNGPQYKWTWSMTKD